MPIPTTPGLVGFIKSRPRMTMTVNGDPRFAAWAGIPQSQQDETGAWHELDPQDVEVVMFGRSAERAFAKLRPGDHFVAEGKEDKYPITQDGQTVMWEYFHASHIGPDNNVSVFTVHRGPERYAAEREATQREVDRQAALEAAEQAPEAQTQQTVAPQAPAPANQAPETMPSPPPAPPASPAVQPDSVPPEPGQVPAGQAPQADRPPQAGPAEQDPVAEVLAHRQQQVAPAPQTATTTPAGPEGIAR